MNFAAAPAGDSSGRRARRRPARIAPWPPDVIRRTLRPAGSSTRGGVALQAVRGAEHGRARDRRRALRADRVGQDGGRRAPRRPTRGRSSPPTRCRRTGACRSSRRSRRGRPRSSRSGRSRTRARSASTPSWRTRRSTGCVAEGRIPVVAGGTGLYFRAALADLEIPPSPPPGARERWEAAYDADPAAAHAELAERDPEAAAARAPERPAARRPRPGADRRRRLAAPTDSRLWSEHTRHPTLDLRPRRPGRTPLRRRIAERARAMLAAGAADEARASAGRRDLADGPPDARPDRARDAPSRTRHSRR